MAVRGLGILRNWGMGMGMEIAGAAAILVLAGFLVAPSVRADLVDTVWIGGGRYVRTLTDLGVAQQNDPFEGDADWPQFQGNAQHLGFNPTDDIHPPLHGRWLQKLSDYPLLAPVVTGTKVVVGRWAAGVTDWPRYLAWCLDSRTGRLLWEGDFGGVWDNSQVVYEDSLLYLHIDLGDDFLAALDVRTGQLRWMGYLSIQIFEPLAPVAYGGRVFTGGNTYGGIHALDCKSGVRLWRVQYAYDQTWTPAIYQDKVYAFCTGRLYVNNVATGDTLFYMNADSITTGGSRGDAPNQAIQLREFGQQSAPILDTVRMRLYCKFYYDLYAFDVSATPSLLWKVTDSSSLRSMPALYDTMLIGPCEDTLKARSTTDGRVLWTFVGQQSFHRTLPPVIANGYLFVSSPMDTSAHNWDPGATYVIDLETHEAVQIIPFGGYLSVGNGQLYIAAADGYLYCFGSAPVDVDDPDEPVLPSGYALYQNQPNPFNPTTEISFSVPVAGRVQIDILNSLGQVVATVADRTFSAGSHTVNWDGSGCASGVYLYRMTAGEYVETKKMVLVK